MAALPNPANSALLREMCENKELSDPYRVLHCIKAKYYNAQKSVIFHLGPDSIAMHSLTTQWCFSQSSKMMMNALLVHHM